MISYLPKFGSSFSPALSSASSLLYNPRGQISSQHQGQRLLQRCMASSSSSSVTRYTINDDVCAPTDEAELRKIVQKHCRTLDSFQRHRPIAAHTRAAFDQVSSFVNSSTTKVILDSGCGTGKSTKLLGEQYPDHLVIGVDRSFTRLSKNSLDLKNETNDATKECERPFQALSSNVILVRAELTDFWRCSLEANWNVCRHYILYPNPYPKKNRIKKRFYAHPAFPLILANGGDIVVRSNWYGYLNEFSKSVIYAHEYYNHDATQKSSSSLTPEEADTLTTPQEGQSSTSIVDWALPYVKDAKRGPVERMDKSIAMTAFERKYDAVGEKTYELILQQYK
eukprot:CAMPEP_0195300386 /NCGR_PEP_ID=MMETSP0707-20130614/27311_1 /TAXON_ID=33640 /ORGANISM="Asterionellopsis glacialis, Strain CCMP134" /LENGTH=337 /DNA_ID=CAMNT_0040363061 /DNA_START=109 /DNA_END=1125 /DNA_ORIENTATION=+